MRGSRGPDIAATLGGQQPEVVGVAAPAIADAGSSLARAPLRTWTYLAIGAFLGLGAPLGLLFERWVLAGWPQVGSWAHGELLRDAETFIYVCLASIAVFGTFGYLMGYKERHLRRANASLKLVAALQKEAARSLEDHLQAARRRAVTLEGRLQGVAAELEDVILIQDTELRYLEVAGKWLGKHRLSPEAFVGLTPREVKGVLEPVAHEQAGRVALSGEPTIYHWKIRTEAGEREMQSSISALRDDRGAVVGAVSVARDVTEESQTRQRLLISDRMVSVGMLAAGVAHEINNPLSAVTANVDVAVQELTEEPRGGRVEQLQNAVEALRDVQVAALRIRDIVRDLKIFSRGDDDVRRATDVERVMESALRMAWNEIRHRARLVKDFQPTPPVYASESRLSQVFLNLVVNAAQAIPEGAAGVNELRVRLFEDAEQRVTIEVKDTGVGMPPEVLARLFTPFFSTKPQGVGTGLGLNICQRVVKDLGGDIEVESQPGKGSLFRVHLPAATEAELEAAADGEVGAAERESCCSGRVLAVDDEEPILTAVSRILGPYHTVCTTTRAVEVLELIRKGECYDVLLVDIMMPEMNGQELYAALCQEAPEQAQRVCLMSGGAFTPEARAFLQEAGREVLEKPFAAQGLRDLVCRMLLRHPASTRTV
ncbi:MAG: response regulator [Deltaproteobacteria bacterium]|nr:response regulator [Deltaproteobacteria bacterium]